jgi:lytic murein transglycosylase
MRLVRLFLWAALLSCTLDFHAAFADAAFQAFLQSLWPQARALGVSRTTFDAATRGLEPDLSLPDLVLPGRQQKPPGQPEFVETPADYLKEGAIEHLAAQGRELYAQYRPTLDAIGRQFGVDPTIVLAIYGRETDYGRAPDSRSAIQVLATQAYLGQRKDKFREEFLYALKIVDEGKIKLNDMKSSWAGAMGLTQFLPSDYLKYAVHFGGGPGQADIWHSVPDALASTAKQLLGEGWQPGVRWAYEVHPPANVDCTIGVPQNTRPLGEWLKDGFVPAYGRKLSPAERAVPASLVQPAGLYGPSFLATANYFAIKQYNFSDLYVLFVGHLADRMLDPRPFETPWAKVAQLPTADLDRMQRILTAQGYYHDKMDGKAGMLTRSALGAYQKRNGLKLDCWPTAAVLARMEAH